MERSLGGSNDSTPLAIVLTNHWRAIAFGTAVCLLVSAAATPFFAKSYRAGCLVLVTPPKAASSLKLAPEPLHMTTAHSLANSDQVLSRTIQLLCDQKTLLAALWEATSRGAEDLGSNFWREIENLDAEQAANLLGRQADPAFPSLWEDLPPVYLLPGLMDLDSDYLSSLDAILIKKHLNSRIRTSLENMHQVEYQPVLQLEAEWESPTGAALVSHAWALTLIRTIEEQYLDPTLELQAVVGTELLAIEDRIAEINQQIQKIEEEGDLGNLVRRKEDLLQTLYGNVERVADQDILPVSGEKSEEEPLLAVTKDLSEDLDQILGSMNQPDSLISRRIEMQKEFDVLQQSPEDSPEQTEHRTQLQARIQALEELSDSLQKELLGTHERIYEIRAEVAALEVDLEMEELKRNYLIRKGAYESQNVDYSEMLGVRLMSPPTPPRTPVSPVIWKIVLVSGLTAFIAMCVLVLVSHTLLTMPPERFARE